MKINSKVQGMKTCQPPTYKPTWKVETIIIVSPIIVNFLIP